MQIAYRQSQKCLVCQDTFVLLAESCRRYCPGNMILGGRECLSCTQNCKIQEITYLFRQTGPDTVVAELNTPPRFDAEFE